MKTINTLVEVVGEVVIMVITILTIFGIPIGILVATLWFIYKLITGLGHFLLEVLKIIFS